MLNYTLNQQIIDNDRLFFILIFYYLFKFEYCFHKLTTKDIEKIIEYATVALADKILVFLTVKYVVMIPRTREPFFQTSPV